MSTQPVITLPLVPVDRRAPLEWSDEDENRPFEIPAWASLGANVVSPAVMSRHFLAIGETGSGKTKSAILPILESALRYGDAYPKLAPAMLVIDPKFELTKVLRDANKPQLLVIDDSAARKRIWLFEGRNSKLDPGAIVDYTLHNCSPSYVAAESSRESFWRDSGFAIIAAFVAADVLRPSRRREPLWETLYRRAGSSILEQFTAMEIYRDTEKRNYYENAFKLVSAAVATGRFYLLTMFAELCEAIGVPPHSVMFLRALADGPDAMRAGQIAEALLFLRDLSNAGLNEFVDLRPTRSPNTKTAGNLSVHDSIDSGKILVFSPDSTSPVNDVIGRVLKTKFFEGSFTRSNKSRPVFYVCDEFHRFVTADPESGEQSFLDRCRAYRVICVLATQSIASLRNGLAANATNASGHLDSTLGVILGNTGNKLFFRTTDSDTQDRLQKFIPRSPVPGDPHVLEVHPLGSLAPGTCYYMFADGNVGRASVLFGGVKSQTRDPRHVARIRVVKALTIDEVLSICDQIERRLTYYWERSLELEIDSPGGQAPALDYFLRRMDQWRAAGARISTLGLTSVASAAGIILSMGEIGNRRAFAGCQLLYHDVRVSSRAEMPITRHTAAIMMQLLNDLDSMHCVRLAQHLFGVRGLPLERRTIDFDHPTLKELELGLSGRQLVSEQRFIEIYQALTVPRTLYFSRAGPIVVPHRRSGHVTEPTL